MKILGLLADGLRGDFGAAVRPVTQVTDTITQPYRATPYIRIHDMTYMMIVTLHFTYSPPPLYSTLPPPPLYSTLPLPLHLLQTLVGKCKEKKLTADVQGALGLVLLHCVPFEALQEDVAEHIRNKKVLTVASIA